MRFFDDGASSPPAFHTTINYSSKEEGSKKSENNIFRCYKVGYKRSYGEE